MTTRRALLAGAAVVGVGAVAAGVGVNNALKEKAGPPPPPATDAQGHMVWRNWSGNQHSYPAERAAPANEIELAALLASAPAPIRAVGAGHSFTALVPTDGTLLTLDRMTGLVGHDAAALTAEVRAGTRLGELGASLAAIGQEMPNLPDINKQTLAGAIATATHGTGHGLTAIHGKLLDLTLLTAQGVPLTLSRDQQPELFDAARVNLGAFGIVTRMTLQNVPLTRVKKTVTMVDADRLMADWPRLRTAHRNAEFYLIPFTGRGILITHDVTTDPVKPRGEDHDDEGVMQLRQARDLLGWSPWLRRKVLSGAVADAPPDIAVDAGWKLLSNERGVPFNEMEYHLPLDAQIDALREVMTAIETRRPDVFFPIEARIIAPDDAMLSPFYQRESGSIAVHAWFKDDYSFLFELIEPILRKHGGRPHWGKLNSLGAADFRKLYPRFDDAAKLRAELDPQGRLLNPYLRKVFGV